jgi:hypothetical protein
MIINLIFKLQLVLSQEVNMAKEALAVGNKDKVLSLFFNIFFKVYEGKH